MNALAYAYTIPGGSYAPDNTLKSIGSVVIDDIVHVSVDIINAIKI